MKCPKCGKILIASTTSVMIKVKIPFPELILADSNLQYNCKKDKLTIFAWEKQWYKRTTNRIKNKK